MICEKCGKEFQEDWRRDKNGVCRFCSTECAHSRVQTKEIKDKIAKTLTTRIKKFCSCGKELNFKNKSGFCKDCKAPAKTRYENVKAFRKKRKEFLLDYKGGKCEICGYDKCIAALEFHHLDSRKKDFSIGDSNVLREKNLEKMLKEVDKCILVCANCHRELHYLSH